MKTATKFSERGRVLSWGVAAALAVGLLALAPPARAQRLASSDARQQLDQCIQDMKDHCDARETELEFDRQQIEIYQRKLQGDLSVLEERLETDQELWMRKAMTLYGPQVLADDRFIDTIQIDGVGLAELRATDEQAVETTRKADQALIRQAQNTLKADFQKWRKALEADRAMIVDARRALARAGRGK